MLTYRDMVAFYSGTRSSEWEAVLGLLGYVPDGGEEGADRPRDDEAERRLRPGDLRATRAGRGR